MSGTLAIASSVSVAAQERSGLYKVGGVSFVAVGALFLSKYLFELSAGQPPQDAADIVAWSSAGEFAIGMAIELLFFAAMLLIPAVFALYRALGGVKHVMVVTGCGLLASMIPVLVMLDIVQGRFVFPVLGFSVDTPAIAAFALAVYYGGIHAVEIIFGVGTFLLGVAMIRGSFSKAVGYLGLAVGVLDVVSSYPEVIGPALVLACQVLFAAWFVAVGVTLYRLRRFTREAE